MVSANFAAPLKYAAYCLPDSASTWQRASFGSGSWMASRAGFIFTNSKLWMKSLSSFICLRKPGLPPPGCFGGYWNVPSSCPVVNE